MQNGISIYAGLDYDIEENLSLIEQAAALGFKKLFTSALIPESTDTETFQYDFADILATAVANGFEIILDVNAENFEQYDVEGLTLRLDDGFTVEQVAEFSHKRKIQLNASTITEEFLDKLLELRTLARDWTRIFSTIRIEFFTTSEFLSERSFQVKTANVVFRCVRDFQRLKTAEIFLPIYLRDFWRHSAPILSSSATVNLRRTSCRQLRRFKTTRLSSAHDF